MEVIKTIVINGRMINLGKDSIQFAKDGQLCEVGCGTMDPEEFANYYFGRGQI